MSLSLNIQSALKQTNIDGWLLTDNPIARRILKIPNSKHITRRFFYFCPKEGEPVKVVHKIEQDVLSHIEGRTVYYAGWREFQELLKTFIPYKANIAVEISQEIPTISYTDGGTISLLHSLGFKVSSSQKLIQLLLSTLTKEQIQSHLYAASVVQGAIEEVYENPKSNTEKGLQKQILQYFERHHCITDHPPIVAFGKNSANPHYAPKSEKATILQGQPLLIDLWCRKNEPDSVYADITRVCFVGDVIDPYYEEIFQIVLMAQENAIEFLRSRIENKDPVYGYEVDQVARSVIEKAGYGECFIHRLGHSIDTVLHGMGAHFDSYETYDTRQILPNTCYSVEPGIYLTDRFGVRLETNVLIQDHKLHITGGMQKKIPKIRI
ncbi:MAG: M24 family metallopeptidase [Chlamydiae bacterium]|nr:M24 family metallopeptidase [Chlamydiota bacterium]